MSCDIMKSSIKVRKKWKLSKKYLLLLTNITERATFFRKLLITEEFEGNLKLKIFLLQYLFVY